jgi:hypothetical protein
MILLLKLLSEPLIVPADGFSSLQLLGQLINSSLIFFSYELYLDVE